MSELQPGSVMVERLPGYAPDLNPIEQLWGNVKTRELANVCAPSLAALRPPLRAGFARVRRQPQLAFAFLRHYDVSQGGVRSWGATAAGSSAFSR